LYEDLGFRLTNELRFEFEVNAPSGSSACYRPTAGTRAKLSAGTVLTIESVQQRLSAMCVLVVISKGKTVGTIGCHKISDREGRFRGMAVLPNVQAQEIESTGEPQWQRGAVGARSQPGILLSDLLSTCLSR
jgi:hypothetical protein